MNTDRLLIRIVASPFIFGMIFVAWQFYFLRHFIRVMRYGGEWVTYEKETPADMTQILNKLKKQSK
jgi:hypothetical protein